MPLQFDRPVDEFDDSAHPLDSVEDVLHANDWVFSRINNDELMVGVTGKHGQYRLFFIWQEEMQALQFCAQYNLHVASGNHAPAQEAIFSLNENLWMGHFDLPRDSGIPTYRHTCLFRGLSREGAMETIEDLVDISLAQCERHYPLFTMLSGANNIDGENLSLALMDPAGES